MQQSEISERGVYWARYTKGGRPIAYAIDSKGDLVRRLVLRDDSVWRADSAIEHLWNYLDVVDPRPQLRLVKTLAVPSTERRATVEVLDPYNLPPLPYSRPGIS